MKISVLGLGAMGTALAHCLIRAGHDVTVWNRTAAKATPLAGDGAQVAPSPAHAIAASPLILTCIKGHREVLELLQDAPDLAGKTLCDLSTGDQADAEELVALLTERGADYMLGMINAYPSGVGQPDTTILTVSPPEIWTAHEAILKTLGGSSAHVGETPSALAALFAGLFTVRQAFMFGMIHGGLVCKAAGIPMQVYADQIPASLKLVHDYYHLFRRTVPAGEYDNAEATMNVYALAWQDALKTVRGLGLPDAFHALMHDQVNAAVKDGLGDKQLTALVDHLPHSVERVDM